MRTAVVEAQEKKPDDDSMVQIYSVSFFTTFTFFHVCTYIYYFILQWVMTDARHDSCVNAYHTTVPCIAGATHKVVGIRTPSRTEHATAQTREVVATTEVLGVVKERGGVNMCLHGIMMSEAIKCSYAGLAFTEVAHNNNVSLTKRIVELGYVNSYDT